MKTRGSQHLLRLGGIYLVEICRFLLKKPTFLTTVSRAVGNCAQELGSATDVTICSSFETVASGDGDWVDAASWRRDRGQKKI